MKISGFVVIAMANQFAFTLCSDKKKEWYQ